MNYDFIFRNAPVNRKPYNGPPWAWQSDDQAYFAHACERGWAGVSLNWRGICETTMGGLDAVKPSVELAVGKPKCGICREELKERYGATEEAGLVTAEEQQQREEEAKAANSD